MTILSNPESRRLGRTIASMQAEIDTLRASQRATQLGNSTLYGAIYIADPDGNVKGIVGEQADGSTGVVVTDGPAPPRPNTPSLTPLMSGVDVAWSGTFAAAKPLNFSHVNVYLSDAGANFIAGPSNLVGTLSDAGSIPVAPLPSGTQWWARLVAVNTSVPAKDSEPSLTTGPVSPDQVVAQAVLDGIVTELALANDAVTAAKIAAGAVGTGEIAGQAVTLSQLASGSVDATKLTNGAVTQPAIAAGAVTANALAANSVIAGKIAADSVTTNNLVAGSVQATQIAAGAVLTDKLAADSVTAAKIASLAVTADSIAANAINAGHITAGAVTASKLAATLVLGTTIIAGTSTTGARVQLNSGGIEAFRSNGMKTLDFDTTTGNMLIAGQYRSGDAGERVLISTDGTETFYASNGTLSGRIENNGTTGLVVRGSASDMFMEMTGSRIGLWSGPQNGTRDAQLSVNDRNIDSRAPVIGLRVSEQFSSPDGVERRVVFIQTNSSGSDRGDSILHYYRRNIGGAAIISPQNGSGIVWASDGIAITTGDPGSYGTLRAGTVYGNINPASSETVKEQVGEITVPDQRSSWDIVEGAPALGWYYLSEDPAKAGAPPGPPLKLRQRRTTPDGNDVPDSDPDPYEYVEVPRGQQSIPARRKHKFPLAEDLYAIDPALVDRDPDHPGQASVDLRDAVGVLWDAVDMLIKRNRMLEERLTALPLLRLLDLPPRPQKGDVREGVGAVIPGRTRRQLDASTGQIRDRVRDLINDRLDPGK